MGRGVRQDKGALWIWDVRAALFRGLAAQVLEWESVISARFADKAAKTAHDVAEK